MTKEKIGPIFRNEFFPNNIDRLYDYMDINENEKEKEKVFELVNYFFDILKLMTPYERMVIVKLNQEACSTGLPNFMHVPLEYFSRVLSIPKDEIISIFSRLDCLAFNSRVVQIEHEDEQLLTNSDDFLEVTFEPFLAEHCDATFIIRPVFERIYNHLCINCAENAINRLDFSILSPLTGYSEKE